MSWEDPTAGLADGEADVAFVWLPLPDAGRYGWTVVAEEPRLVALPETHPLADRPEVDFADLADEPFLALPQSAGPLRDHWLALDERGGRAPRIGAEIASTEETLRGPGRRPRRLPAGLGQRTPDHPRRRGDPPGPGPLPGPLRPGLAPHGRRPPVRAYARACGEVRGQG